MRVFHKLKKVFAVIMSVVTMACCLGAMQASALTVNVNSKIAYDLYVEKVSNNRVALHINFTKNPGINTLSFMVYYDDACTFLPSETEYSGISMTQDASDVHKRACFAFMNPTPLSSNFSIICYFKTSDSSNNSHEFSTAISQCSTVNGNGDIDHFDGMNVILETSTPYVLGDVDNNSYISIQDAYAILKISKITGGNSISVSYANSILATLRKLYPNLVCAEVADVDFDNKITASDAQQVQIYHVNESIGTTTEDTFIGTQFYKTITA